MRSIVATARSAATRKRVAELGLADQVVESNAAAVEGADLVIVCIPVGACGAVAKEIGPHLTPGATVSDVGSVKGSVRARHGPSPARRACISSPRIRSPAPRIPAPTAGFAELFVNRWCILTPPPNADSRGGRAAAAFWRTLGANVETMPADHHDLVLGITSHLPHLIAYTIVGTADELGEVTRSEVLKFSAGGFRDFTRIAASDPTMWRDVFLANKDAVLEMLGTLQRGSLGAHPRDAQRRRPDAVRSFHPHARDPPRHRRDRPGFAGAGFRPRRIPTCRPSRCRGPTPPTTSSDSIQNSGGVAPSWQRPERHRAVVEAQRQHHRALAFELGRLAHQVDAGDDRRAGVLPRHIAEPRHDAIERAERVVELRRRLLLRQHAVEAERRQELLQIGDGEAKLAVEPARAATGRARRWRPRACRPAARARCAISMRPPAACNSRNRAGQGLGEKSFKPAQHRGDVGVDRRGRGRMPGRRGRRDELEHDLDHRIVLHRAGHHAAVELEPRRP